MRLLVIEDEQELAAALSRGLTAEGYTVDTAYDGVPVCHRLSPAVVGWREPVSLSAIAPPVADGGRT